MKKLLSLLLVFSMLAALPLLAGATDQISQGAEKLSLTFAMQVAGEDSDQEEIDAINSVMGYVGSLELDMVVALHDDALQAVVTLMQGEKDLGTLEVLVDQETLNVRGDMLPEGWLSVKLEDLGEAMDLDTFGDQFEEAMGQQQAAMETGMLLFQTLTDSAEQWLMNREDLLEEKSVEGLSADMDPVSVWGRVHIPAEMYPEIFGQANATLKEMAEQGMLKDFDGTPIAPGGYESSMLGQMMGQMVEEFKAIKIEGVVDILMDDQGGLPGFAVDVSADAASFFMRMQRKTESTGDAKWTGNFLMEQPANSAKMNGELSASLSEGNGMSQADFAMLGRYEWIPSYYSSTTAQPDFMDFDVKAYWNTSEGTGSASNFDGRMDMRFVSSDDEDVQMWFAAKGEADESAQNAKVMLGAGFDMNAYSSAKADMELGLTYAHQEEGLQKPDLESETRVFLMDLDTEGQAAYEKEMEGTLSLWMVRLMASMPSDVLMMLMNGGF